MGRFPTWEPDVVAEIDAAIRARVPDIIVNMSTGVIGPDVSAPLACLSRIRPEMAALNAGAEGYLLKDSDPDDIAAAIRSVHAGESPLDPTGLGHAGPAAIGAFWELIEWWTTLVVAGDTGTAFLGSQGDVWDAQWDMFLVGVGAAVSLATLSRVHDRSMSRIPLKGA